MASIDVSSAACAGMLAIRRADAVVYRAAFLSMYFPLMCLAVLSCCNDSI